MSVAFERDGLLLERAIEGDENATEQVLRIHYETLFKVVRKMIGQSDYPLATVDDIVQETMIEAFRSIKGFKPEGENAVLRWMATIAYNKFADAVRVARALKRGGGSDRAVGCGGWSNDSLAQVLEQVASPLRSPSGFAASSEAVVLLKIGIARLKDEYREAIQHRFIEGKTFAEAGALMNKTAKAVERLCDRALACLRTSLGSGSKFPST